MNKKVLVSIGAGTMFSEYARLLIIDLATKEIIKTFDYKHRVYEQSTKGFTGLFRGNDHDIWACTETEIVHIQLPEFKILNYCSPTFFNDVHYCYVDDKVNKVFVANTGLDSVEIFNKELEHVQSIALVSHTRYTPKVMRVMASRAKEHVVGTLKATESQRQNDNLFTEDKRYKNLSERVKFDKVKKFLFPGSLYNGKDLRYVLFRPHILHPNFVTKVEGTMLVTLKNTGEIIELNTRKRVIGNLKGPHDGVLARNKFLITESGTGKILYKDHVSTLEDIRKKELQEMQVCSPKEGFIRGIDMLDDQIAIAAISKRREIKDEQPAWLAIVDLQNRQLIDKVEIPETYGTNPFSVIDISDCFSSK